MNVVVTADARELRRAVGATAWCVLEELVLDASLDHQGRSVASTNVRRLAAAVGVSKDTAARAVARLARAGVVERVTSVRGERGTFPTAAYVVDVTRVPGLTAHAPMAVVTAQPEPPSVPLPRTRTRRASHADTAQPSLFDSPATRA